MFPQQRHELIIQRLIEDKSIRTSELIELFGVSFETIRRDLEYLEGEGYLKRVHGGAIPKEPDYSKEIPLPLRESIYVEEKTELAGIAARFVSEGMSIALDVSTTNLQIVKALKTKFNRLTIITNSLPIINELINMPDYTLIMIGGIIRQAEQSIIGDLAEEFTSRFHADLFFMSLSGVTLEEGITDNAIGEIQVKKIMHANAKRTIALTDSSKFEQLSLLKVCNCKEVECFVTDSKISRNIVEKYRAQGIEIVFQ
ncbi:DeoR/GlpR family DNA-binding transcription regulator [Sporosarcina sp. Te-1]|uniref:DeoR/GlpR family DNA-binding transcription regulator n=1 Tax=Sporosarcina sp. Te-1 TaxID=2818390 RepID=UPI001A9D30A4|nr:DeoR/GlpR family DNA-binding transcription regulator [Sporosarcina sp. Te-1]QTD40996.1 DeoR/GlpR transcriptional regulator [Sporosarcina sp. Te-1]